jgi:hypothetical protein
MKRERLWVQRILAVATATAGLGCGAETTTNEGDAAREATVAREGGLDASEDVKVDDAKPDGAMDVRAPDVLSARRPFLVGSSLRVAHASTRDDWRDELPQARGLDDATSAALALAWLADGLEEHASIAAFARFSMLMLSMGAPPELVTGAQRASLDEVRHARACFSLARRYGANEAGPGPLRVDDALGRVTLADLAALTAEEGCVGETLGALLAEEQAALARDRVVRPLIERIARDETRHAELAWRFVAWAIAKGGSEVLRRVETAAHRAMTATLAMEVRSLAVDAPLWREHGRLSCAEARAVASRGAKEVVLPALRALHV